MHGPADPWGETLQRRLGPWSAVAVLVGGTIGSGIFRTPAVVATRIGDVPTVLFAWALGGALSLAGALTFAELAAAWPRSGGMYVFLREAFGRRTAFLFGWAELLVLRPGAYGAISVTSAAYALRAAGVDPGRAFGPFVADRALAALLLVVVALVNVAGVHRGAVLQNASTLLKVGALLVLVAAGLGAGGLGGSALAQRGPVEASPFLLAMVSILWAYDGWAGLTFMAGEIAEPQRHLPRALAFGTLVVVGLYLAANVVYLHLVPLATMATTDLVAAEAARVLVGPAGVTLLCGVVAVSTFGTLNGSMMTAPRIFFAMAEDGLFPGVFARVHPKTGAPTAAIVLAAGLGVAFVSVRTFAQLADQFVIGVWPFYAACVVAVFVLRRTRPDLVRPYRTVGYPWVPAAFLLASCLLLANYAFVAPWTVVFDLVVVATGLPVFAWWDGRSRRSAMGRDNP